MINVIEDTKDSLSKTNLQLGYSYIFHSCIFTYCHMHVFFAYILYILQDEFRNFNQQALSISE